MFSCLSSIVHRPSSIQGGNDANCIYRAELPAFVATFILNDLLSLERLGARLSLFAMTNPHEAIVQPEVAQLQAPIVYLDDVVPQEHIAQLLEHVPVSLAHSERYTQTRAYIQQHQELDSGYTTANRFVCFAMAVYITQFLEHEQERTGEQITHIHAHFAHDPTLIAQLVSMLTGISYSFTAHARDLYQVLPASLLDRVRMATAVATCSAMNMDYFQQVLPAAVLDKVQLIYHGVDVERFQPKVQVGSNRVPQIVSIGRLVEKKGFGDLLAACGQLKTHGQPFHLTIYGEGPLYNTLLAQIESLGLQSYVTLPGACTQRELVPVLQRADLFALTPFVTEDGDRDGVPNVLVEAMATGLPVVSTVAAGIPELVRNGYNGLLVPARDIDAIAATLSAALADPPRRRAMGAAARQTVLDQFDLQSGAQQMLALFQGVAEPLRR